MKYLNLKDEDAVSVFVKEAIEKLGDKYIPLRFWHDEDLDENWEERGYMTRRLALWATTDGVLPSSFWKARAEGKLAVWDSTPVQAHWMLEEGLDLPVVSLDSPPNSWKDLVVVYKVPLNGRLPQEFSKSKAELSQHGVVFKSEHDLFTEHMTEMSFTNEDVKGYLLSIGGMWSENGEITVNLDRWTAVTVIHDEEHGWFYREGTVKKQLRRFHSLNGKPIASNTALLLALGYLFASPTATILRGRQAYMSEVFVDPIYTGFSHPLVEKLNLNKLGCIDSTFKAKGDLVLVKASTLVPSLLAYRALGYSTFMHKGGKFGVVDAGFMGVGLSAKRDDVFAIFADKPEKALGRMLALVPTAAEYDFQRKCPALKRSAISFRDKYSEVYTWYGVRYYEAAVLSPLVEEGSGELLEHPQATRTLCESTSLTYDIEANSEEEAKANLWFPKDGDILETNQAWLTRKNVATKTTLARWTGPSQVIVRGTPAFRWNPHSNTLHVRLEGYKLLKDSLGEKFRGGGKASGNGGFTRNIHVEVSGTDELVFNPGMHLFDDDGNTLQVEHVVGAEEFKTSFYITELVATANSTQFVWDETNLCWDNQQQVESLIEKSVERVDVYRGDINPRIYSMFKAMYEGKDNWVFDDSTCSVIHKGAMCWRGYKTQIIEVPTVSTFAGRCSVFAEQYTYIGTEFPLLYSAFLKEVERNRELLNNAITMATAEDLELEEILTIDRETLIEEGDSLSLELEEEDGLSYVQRIVVPEGMEYNTKFLFGLDKAAKANGFKGYSLVTEGSKGNTNCLLLDMKAFAVFGGSAAQPLTAKLFELFRWLEYDLDERDTLKGFDAIIHRLASSIRGRMEAMLFESDSLFSKATKTTRLAITGRARSTIDASVEDNEVHFHPISMKYWGLEEGDTLVWGRVPVPGVGISRVVINDKAQPYTALFPAGVKHEVEEGDVDGDSFLAIVVSSNGLLKIPNGDLQEVNPLTS